MVRYKTERHSYLPSDPILSYPIITQPFIGYTTTPQLLLLFLGNTFFLLFGVLLIGFLLAALFPVMPVRTTKMLHETNQVGTLFF